MPELDTPITENGSERTAGGDGSKNAKGGNSENGGQPAAAKVFPQEFVEGLYQENGKHRLLNKELKEKLKAYEDAALAAEAKKLEEEKEFKKLADEAEKRAKKAEKDASEKVEAQRRKTIKTAVRAELIKEGVLDQDDVALLDLTQITWDDDADEPDGIGALVTAFKKAKPGKFKTEASGEGNGGNTNRQLANTNAPGGSSGKNTRSIDYRDPSVTREEINRAWEAKFSRT